MPNYPERILTNRRLFLFAKDKDLKYTYCNEAMAEVAGLDSPQQIIGKTDHELIWHQHAEFYRFGDQEVLQGHVKINAPEVQTQTTHVANVLTSKMILRDEKSSIIGIGGHYIDITGYTVVKNQGYYHPQHRKFYLGPEFNNAYFTHGELIVFKMILLGQEVAEIAKYLSRSKKTVESYIQSIKIKLQCEKKSQIVPLAMRYGLTYVLDDIALQNNIPVAQES